MRLLRKLDELDGACAAGTCVTIGVFDAVHRGHQALIQRAREEARRRGILSLVFTFERHPLNVLAPAYCPPAILQPDQKAALIAGLGVDLSLLLEFTAEFASISAGVFIEDILVGKCRTKFLNCGRNFSFGAGAKGHADLLIKEGKQFGFDVEILELVSEGASMVSSSRIRQSLLQGRVEDAATMLTRPYGFAAQVITGDQRGRQIGYPTANLLPPADQLIPADGVYAVRVAAEQEGPRLGGMLNIGTRPTFDAGRSIEVHLFDFSGELVGRTIEVEFLSRIRDERKFASVDALIAQLKQDEAACRVICASAP
ncbi:bifunctional riboflavin kinase/FAD synthetase [Candidatus Sumerlaeota bacterium]|nr:bifunctional riboflavin kinase/FAD synthetase [Candidatus Sumerlaeota bacterium]